MAFLEIRNLWKSYGDQVVLERLNQQVDEGEFITMVGASGCGKTTFLKMLLGTESPSRGGLVLDGKPLQAEPGIDRGVVFQRYSVFPHLSAVENVMFALDMKGPAWRGRLFGKARRAAREEAVRMLESVGLAESLEKYPHQLSGGMQQRLALAQALIARPRILLLDEPFGALDPGIRRDMHQLVMGIWQANPITVFMITHDLVEGFYLGTRLWVFDKVRDDPHAPGAFGARITYDLPVAADGQLSSKDDRRRIARFMAEADEVPAVSEREHESG